MEEKRTNLMPIVIIELLIIIALIGLVFYTMSQKPDNKCKEEPKTEEKAEKKEEQQEEPKKEEEQPVQNDSKLVKAFKEYYINEEYADKDNILTWDITKEEKVDNKKYNNLYLLEGTFSCKDGADDCVYLEQVGDPVDNKYEFKLYVQVTETNGQYTFKVLGTYIA